MKSLRIESFLTISIIYILSCLSLVKCESLTENQIIQTFITTEKNHTYNINLGSESNLKKILIDLMIFSGDVIINFTQNNSNIHKYETANKIFFSINAHNLQSPLKFEVIAQTNSYYSIRYTTVKDTEEESGLVNEIPINTNFLITIYPFDEEGGLSTLSKKLKFVNNNINNKRPFLINFNSLNCEFNFYKLDKNENKIKIPSKDDYFAQDLIKSEDEIYPAKNYYYVLDITMIEQGTYNKKMCMVHASSTELGSRFKNLEKNILVGENVAQKAIFNSNGVNNIKYLYEIPDINNDLAIKFILSIRAEYEVYFYINNIKNKIRNITVGTKQQEIIESSSYSNLCEQNQKCELYVEIQLKDNNQQNKDLELEVTIKSISSIHKYPSYLLKNEINREYLNFKSPNYYYTDIGQKISGEVIVNYYRGKGMVFGKIVKKTHDPMAHPEWRGIYEFPSKTNGTLKYVSYLKKLIFTEEDTKDCEDECYLLLNVVNNITSKTNNNDDSQEHSRYFGFDILIITNSLSIQSLSPLIMLPIKRYVIGSISKVKSSPDYSRYYMINIPYDAEKVVFDMQSENAAMYINVYLKENRKYKDYKYPSNAYHMWKFFSNGKQQFFELNKTEILEGARNIVETLDLITLTICIEAESNDNDLSTIYALKYHLELNQKLNIYEIYSDQQTFCQTNKIDNNGKYTCLYLVKYNKNDVKYHILLYPILENESTDFQVYADFIKRETYDLYIQQELENLIPKSGSEYSTESLKEKFLYINLNNKSDSYLYIKIETDKNTKIRLLSTFSTFDYTSVPNPSTAQLYIIKDNEMKFDFIYKEDILINLESVLGSANIFWQDEETKNNIYRLRGRDDRLSLASIPERQGQHYIYNSLIIRNNHISSKAKSQISGAFIFYMTFYLRTTKINFDKLEFGKSFNLNYRDTSFPLSLYYKVDDIQKDTNAFVTIYTLDGNERKLPEEKEFNVYATILSDNSIYKIRSNPEIDIKIEDTIPGIYDPSKRVCLISLKSINLEKYKIPENESPNLVIKISKNSNTGKDEIYNHISIEGTVIQDHSLIPVTEKVYQHGKLKNGTNEIIYKLSTIEGQNITLIILSSNGDLLDYKISTDIKDDVMVEEFNKNKKIKEGRIITYIHSKPEQNKYIYLTICRKDNKNQDEILTNYVFKYINVDDLSKIKLYHLKDNNIAYTKKENSNHLIQVENINCENCFLTYYVNFILKPSLIKGENFDNIAVIQSVGITKEFDNKNIKINNDKVNLEINDISENKNISNIQVIAHINEGSINEYIAFKSLIINEEKKEDKKAPDKEKEEKKENNGNNKTLIIIIIAVSCVFIIIVIVLIIIMFNIKKKNILRVVNDISFKADKDDEESDHASDLLIN